VLNIIGNRGVACHSSYNTTNRQFDVRLYQKLSDGARMVRLHVYRTFTGLNYRNDVTFFYMIARLYLPLHQRTIAHVGTKCGHGDIN
jgi:hypothetical protein